MHVGAHNVRPFQRHRRIFTLNTDALFHLIPQLPFEHMLNSRRIRAGSAAAVCSGSPPGFTPARAAVRSGNTRQGRQILHG